MSSHHFIGSGPYSPELAAGAREPRTLLARVTAEMTAVGFEVVADTVAPFPSGGLTLVWVLAESHLVIHYWGAEGFATVDLHICDYQGSNRSRARALVERLEGACFLPGLARWRELSVPTPRVPARA